MPKVKREMSVEERAIRSARMKALHASGAMKRKGLTKPEIKEFGLEVTTDRRKVEHNTIQEPLAPAVSEPRIHIDVNWLRIPMPLAQALYARLRKEIDEAGRILNNRSMPQGDQYVCHVCQTKHDRPAKGIDFAHKSELTGLMEPVECCGERCWTIYQQEIITARRNRNIAEREAHGT